MKLKTTFLIAVISIFTGQVSGQIVSVLNENFNSGIPAGWQSIDADGNTPHSAVAFAGNAFSTHIDFDTTGTGDSILIAASWFDPAGMADNYLITPQITLEANGNQLFWQAMSKDPSYPESYEILVSTTLPVIDSFHAEPALHSISSEYPDWTEYVLDLDQYAGQQVYLAFRHTSNDKFLLCLDNIRVVADLQLGISGPAIQQEINLYPNPAAGNLFIKTAGENISCKVTDISGREFVTPVISNSGGTINLSTAELPAGVYIILVNVDGILSHSRFIRAD